MRNNKKYLFLLIVLIILASNLTIACGEAKETSAPTPISSPTSTPMTAEQHFEKAVTLSENGQYQSAIQDLTRAIELDPNYAEAYYLRGIDYMAKKEYDKTITDLGKAVGLGASEKEAYDLKRVVDLIVPPGELILLDMSCFSEGGIDCLGNPKPYNNTLRIQLFINPGESVIEINNIYISPAINAKTEIKSPIKYFDNLGMQFLVTCLSSETPPTTAPSCSVDYKPRNDSSYKKSNELTNTYLYIEELVCPSSPTK